MKSKKASLPNIPFLLTLILALALILGFAHQCSAARIINESFENTEDTGYDETWSETVGTGCTLDADSLISGTSSPYPRGAGSQCLQSVSADSGYHAYTTRDYGSEESRTFTRMYVYVEAEGLGNNKNKEIAKAVDDLGNDVFILQLHQDPHGLQLRFRIFVNGSFSTPYTENISLTTWYRVEIKYDDSNPLAVDAWEWRVDDTTKNNGSLTGDHRAGIQEWQCGFLNDGASETGTVLFDLVAVDNTDWVGEEPVGYVGPAGDCAGYVPCNNSINSAIGPASSGDTIFVFGGTYNENITMKDGVDVVNNPGDTPIIDGGGNDSVVTITGEFLTGCTLDGFDLINGGSNPGIDISGAETGITNSTIIKNCSIHANGGPGIKLDGTDATTAPFIDNNDIYGNSEEGIYIIDAGGTEEEHAQIVNNTIRENIGNGMNIGGASYLTIDNNLIRDNHAGIAFDTGNPSSLPVNIVGNDIYSNEGVGETGGGGIGVVDAVTGKVTITQNDIHENARGGIGIQNACDVDITKNTIRGNIRGGIHTGTDVADDVFSDAYGFIGGPGSADLTITKNKVYHNGQSGYGGGIDVRHASGTIENNLVYGNARGGIRYGDYVTEILHNTVVYNGQNAFGGGIIFDDLAGVVNARPNGTLSGSPLIKNNISAYNEKAGFRVGGNGYACPADNPGYDYNLLYANYPWNDVWSRANPPDCGWPTPTIPDDYTCTQQQYGGCGAYVDSGIIVLNNPNDIIDDPEFVPELDNYHLEDSSPAKTGGEGGVEMGAYGGTHSIDW